jgi:DNA-binding winged helix-turn-helix (wHTH) protein
MPGSRHRAHRDVKLKHGAMIRGAAGQHSPSVQGFFRVQVIAMILRFGDFVVDPDARLLYGNGEPIHLPPKAFNLLLALLECRPKALSKAELMERLWPGTYVQEVNLSNAVGELRSALGDRSSPSRYIRTVHGFGYAFSADVREEATHAPDRASVARRVSTSRVIWGNTTMALPDGVTIVGRDEGAGLVLEETTVSRRHAQITVRNGAATIEDLGSQNGTWVNERQLAGPTALADGDRVRFGLALVIYRTTPPAMTTAPIPQR